MFVLDYPVWVTAAGAICLGLSSGIISCYAVLKEQSLLGDAIAHAALPGLCIAFLLTLSKSPIILLLGALGAGWLGTMFILAIVRRSILKEDTALGVILSVFFGFGILLLTLIQRIPSARQSGLDTYLFGSAASMLLSDVWIMCGATAVISAIVLGLWKEFKLLTFDRVFLKSIGFRTKRIDILLTSLMVITIIIGLQTVGVILMSALMIAPGTAARQWTNRFSRMIILSVIFSSLSGLIGVFFSSSLPKMPTGPAIVVCISIIVLISISFSPRGFVTKWVKSYWHKAHIHRDSIIRQLYILASTHDNKTHPHNVQALSVFGGPPPTKRLKELQQSGLIYHKNDSIWGLTTSGIEHAEQLLKETS